MRRNKKLYLGLGLLSLVSFFLTPIGQVVATKISDLTAMTVDQIADPSSVFVLATDAQSGNTSKKIPLDQLGLATELKLVTATSHGFSSGDVGKPLYGSVEFDDTSGTTYPTWVLAGVVDANTLLVAGDGAQVTIDVGLLDGGNTYDVGTSGYSVYWDASAGEYTATLPADSKYVDHVLLITKVDTTDFDAIVVGKGGLEETNAVVVRGSGVAATDNTNFANAITTLQANGDSGVIYISGSVDLTGTHSISEAISIEGVPGTNATIDFNGSATIGWNASYNPLSGSSTTVTGVKAGDSDFSLPTGTLDAGDWFYITSEDDIEGVTHHGKGSQINSFTVSSSTDKFTKTSHGLSTGDAIVVLDDGTGIPSGITGENTYWVIGATANDFQISETKGGSAVDILATGMANVFPIYGYWPGELHQVKELRNPVTPDGNDYYIIDDAFCDTYTTNARIYKVTPIENVSVKNINVTSTSASSATNPAFQFRKLSNVRVSNIHYDYNGPNEMLFLFCSNVIISDVVSELQDNFNTGEGYVVVAGSCNGLLFRDSLCKGMRHVFTTGEIDDDYARIGSIRNAKIVNVTAITAGTSASSQITFDTHTEGFEVEFINCTCIIPNDPRNPSAGSPVKNSNYGYSSRARGTVWRNCKSRSNGSSYHLSMQGSYQKVIGCQFDGGWRGIYLRDWGQGYAGAHNCVIKGNHFTGMYDSPIILDTGKGHTVAENTFERCGATGYSTTTGSLIAIATDAVSNVNIVHNQLDRNTIPFTVDASTEVVTAPGHAYTNGERIRVDSTTTLPGGLSASTVYYAYNVDQIAGTMQLTTSPTSTTPVNITTTGTGTHVLFSNVYSVGGDDFEASDIRLVGNTMTGYAGWASGLPTDSGFNSSNADAVDLQAEADSYNWTD